MIRMPFKFRIIDSKLDSSYSASCSDSAFISTSERLAVLLNGTTDSERIYENMLATFRRTLLTLAVLVGIKLRQQNSDQGAATNLSPRKRMDRSHFSFLPTFLLLYRIQTRPLASPRTS